MNAFIFPAESTSLAKKQVSPTIWTAFENRATDSGFTLARAIASGLKNPDSAIGIYAGDAQSYDLFSPVFDPIIREYHGEFEPSDRSTDISCIHLSDLDPEARYIQSTRIRVARNMAGFSFPCHIHLSRRHALEKKIVSALRFLPAGLKGAYYSFEHTDKTVLKQLETENRLFPKGDRFQDAAGINADFPKCRGVYLSLDKQFMIWVNEEDHLRIISLENTSDLSRVYNRICTGLAHLNQHLDFAWDRRYGYLTSCPTNLGTAMRAGVHIQLEKLEQKKEILFSLVKAYNLQIRGTGGEKTAVDNAVFDISNRQRLGISESRIIQNLHAGLLAIISAEKRL